MSRMRFRRTTKQLPTFCQLRARRGVRPAAFSLIELVIVIIIIGILAAIAIPRFGSASSGSGESSLRADLVIVRRAINMYFVEHGSNYPDGTNIRSRRP